MSKWITLIVIAIISLPAMSEEAISPIKPRPSLQPRKLELPIKRLPTTQKQEEATPSTEDTGGQAEETPEEQPSGTQPAAPSPVTITAVDMNIVNCQYRWTISFRNDSSTVLNNLTVGGKQKGPHLNTFHGAGGVLVSSIAPGQVVTKTIGWARDIRATEFYVFVAQGETNELATQSYNIPALSASIGQISFSHQTGSTYNWTAEINNPSTIPICGGITIVRKRLADSSMQMGAVTKGLTISPGESSQSGSWDASNATGFNLRLSADSGAARATGVWMLDEKEVPFSP